MRINLFENFSHYDNLEGELEDIWRELEDLINLDDFLVSHVRNNFTDTTTFNVLFTIDIFRGDVIEDLMRLVEFTQSVLGLKLTGIHIKGFDQSGKFKRWAPSPTSSGGIESGWVRFYQSKRDQFILRRAKFHFVFHI